MASFPGLKRDEFSLAIFHNQEFVIVDYGVIERTGIIIRLRGKR